MSRPTHAISWGVFLPGLLIAVTIIVQAITTRSEFNTQIDVLNTQFAQQRTPLEQATVLRNQLESIAGATAVLAEQGNQNAILIRDQLKAQGVSINPPRE